MKYTIFTALSLAIALTALCGCNPRLFKAMKKPPRPPELPRVEVPDNPNGRKGKGLGEAARLADLASNVKPPNSPECKNRTPEKKSAVGNQGGLAMPKKFDPVTGVEIPSSSPLLLPAGGYSAFGAPQQKPPPPHPRKLAWTFGGGGRDILGYKGLSADSLEVFGEPDTKSRFGNKTYWVYSNMHIKDIQGRAYTKVRFETIGGVISNVLLDN